MTLLRSSLVCVAFCFASQAASAVADATVSLGTPRLTPPAVLQLDAVPHLQEHVPSQTLPSDYDRNVKRAGRGRILLAAGVPLLVFGTPLVAWAATADDCYSPGDDLSGFVIAGSVMAGTGFVLTSAGIAQLVRAGKKARRSDQTPPRFRRWAIPIGFASGLLSVGVFLTGFIGGSIGCYTS